MLVPDFGQLDGGEFVGAKPERDVFASVKGGNRTAAATCSSISRSPVKAPDGDADDADDDADDAGLTGATSLK